MFSTLTEITRSLETLHQFYSKVVDSGAKAPKSQSVWPSPLRFRTCEEDASRLSKHKSWNKFLESESRSVFRSHNLQKGYISEGSYYVGE